MKKPATDNTPAYMAKGATNNNAQNAPKGNTFDETLTSKPPNPGLGLEYHKRSAKSGNRHGGPTEHLNPKASTFHKL